MKKVGAWEASDGERFETRKDCAEHEARLEAERFFEVTLGSLLTDDSPGKASRAIVNRIVADHQHFREIIRDLIGLSERKGKPRGEAAKPKRGSRSAAPVEEEVA